MDLEELVDHTAGPRPWRRLTHLAIGVSVAVAVSAGGISRRAAVLALASVFAGLCIVDIVRLRSARANELYFRALRHLATPREATGVASPTWYALGMLAAVALFPMRAAVSGILVLAVGDPAASYVGRRWGRRRFLGGTLAGTIAFVCASLGVLAPRHPPLVAFAVALVAALAERLSWPVDDNVTLPLVTAGIATLLDPMP